MRSGLTALLALSRTLKQTQPRFEIQGGDLPAGRNDADHLTSGDPFDLVARTDPRSLSRSGSADTRSTARAFALLKPPGQLAEVAEVLRQPKILLPDERPPGICRDPR